MKFALVCEILDKRIRKKFHPKRRRQNEPVWVLYFCFLAKDGKGNVERAVSFSSKWLLLKEVL